MPDEHTPFPSPKDPSPGLKSEPGQGAVQRRKAFVRLANARMVQAIDAITLIGNLANKKNYKFTEKDVEAMEAALLTTIERTMLHFKSPRAEAPSFQLPEEEC